MKKEEFREKVSGFFDELHPSNCIYPLEKRANQALESFSIEGYLLDSDQKCDECLSDFIFHLHLTTGFFSKSAEGKKGDKHFRSLCQGDAWRLLERPNPPWSQWSIYYRMISGSDGGVYDVLKQLTQNYIKDRTQKSIMWIIINFFKPFDFDHRWKIIEIYVKKFRDILPKNYSEKNAIHIGNYIEMLGQHPWILRDLETR